MLLEVLEEMGCPYQVFSDGGLSLIQSRRKCMDLGGFYVDKSAPYSLWQNGMAERHGGIWKTIFKKAFRESAPTNKQEVGELVDHVNNAKNSMTCVCPRISSKAVLVYRSIPASFMALNLWSDPTS